MDALGNHIGAFDPERAIALTKFRSAASLLVVSMLDLDQGSG